EQTPAASATASGVCPLSTCRTIRSRPRGVSRAFLCMFIRFSLWNLKLQQPQLPRSEPGGQPNESSQLAKKCSALTAKVFPPRVIGNPAAGSAKGSGLAEQAYFKRCVASGGKIGDDMPE